jgi:hypothetical protein
MLLCVLFLSFCFFRQAKGETRSYHIAAVEIKWDYAPTGYNQINGKPLDEDR